MIYNSPACPLTKSALDVLDIGVSLFTKQASKATHCPLTALSPFALQIFVSDVYLVGIIGDDANEEPRRL